MLDRQRLVWSRQAEKLNVAYVSVLAGGGCVDEFSGSTAAQDTKLSANSGCFKVVQEEEYHLFKQPFHNTGMEVPRRCP